MIAHGQVQERALAGIQAQRQAGGVLPPFARALGAEQVGLAALRGTGGNGAVHRRALAHGRGLGDEILDEAVAGLAAEFGTQADTLTQAPRDRRVAGTERVAAVTALEQRTVLDRRLGDDVDHPAHRRATVERGKRPAHDFDTGDAVRVHQRPVDAVGKAVVDRHAVEQHGVALVAGDAADQHLATERTGHVAVVAHVHARQVLERVEHTHHALALDVLPGDHADGSRRLEGRALAARGGDDGIAELYRLFGAALRLCRRRHCQQRGKNCGRQRRLGGPPDQ